ncbi:MAG TPA: 50S ribosomal protein L11 methyltransferase [Stellaceae bacterium]|jgi:methylase of polypeptide subunit release factors|nr:50S ribosomal protein L11 methyltransferase [Stellaceae bacterium]
MTGLSLAAERPAAKSSPQEAVALRPSEYTAALIDALRTRPGLVRGATVLEIGSGSGVVLAAAAALGAAELCGVDIEESAVATGAVLLHGMGHGDHVELLRGDMWRPVGGRRFDLILANLPQFPMERRFCQDRLPSWSAGGTDGRQVMDRFLTGLADHLTACGRTVITHNAFIDLERSRSIARAHGLSLRSLATLLVHIPPEKFELMTGGIRVAEEGRSIHRYGPHAFAEMHVAELRRSLED